MHEPILLATDLDGTLLGDEAAMRRFAAWIEPRRSQVTLAYATGRRVDSIEQLVSEDKLVAPQYLATLVGTELTEYSSGKPVGDWVTCDRAGWNANIVRDVLSRFPELDIQPEEFQSPRKVSYFLRRASSTQLQRFDTALTAAGIAAEIVYSCEEFLDFLPRNVNKGAAIAYLSRYIGFPPDRVVACGDSGNDLSLLSHGFCGVVVGNAWSDLYWNCPTTTYRSIYRFADGVIEGVEYWMQRPTTPPVSAWI